MNAIHEIGGDLHNALPERIEIVGFHLLKRALADNESALKIIAAIDENQGLAVVDVSEELLGVAGFAADAEPESVNGNAGFDYFEAGGIAGDGVASIATDNQVGVNVPWGVRAATPYTRPLLPRRLVTSCCMRRSKDG